MPLDTAKPPRMQYFQHVTNTTTAGTCFISQYLFFNDHRGKPIAFGIIMIHIHVSQQKHDFCVETKLNFHTLLSDLECCDDDLPAPWNAMHR